MKKSRLCIVLLWIFAACSERTVEQKNDFVIADGQMPGLVKDKKNILHLVYGLGDSLLYSTSTDGGKSFSGSSLISVLPHVYTFATRGPQIACSDEGIIVTACTSSGDIFSFQKNAEGNWKAGPKVNDVDTIAKEGLMALGADGEIAFSAWLDLRGDGRNKIYGTASHDGGKTWAPNKLIYASPDTTVCECCKPSVVVQGNTVYVMFRNWLEGNRDMHVIKSTNGGKSFNQPEKLGQGSWKLNGCPMDGGGLAINGKGELQTVWRRAGKVYTAAPAMPEKELGEGRGCTIETINNQNVYAWIENGNVVISKTAAQKEIVGQGAQPVLQAIDKETFICVWENEKKIHASIRKL